MFKIEVLVLFPFLVKLQENDNEPISFHNKLNYYVFVTFNDLIPNPGYLTFILQLNMYMSYSSCNESGLSINMTPNCSTSNFYTLTSM